jgi:predicted transcriptional regulator
LKGEIIINLNINQLTGLIDKDFNGKYKEFAKAVNVNYVTIYRIVTGRSNPGEKFISNFIDYCKKKKYLIEKFF